MPAALAPHRQGELEEGEEVLGPRALHALEDVADAADELEGALCDAVCAQVWGWIDESEDRSRTTRGARPRPRSKRQDRRTDGRTHQDAEEAPVVEGQVLVLVARLARQRVEEGLDGGDLEVHLRLCVVCLVVCLRKRVCVAALSSALFDAFTYLRVGPVVVGEAVRDGPLRVVEEAQVHQEPPPRVRLCGCGCWVTC